MSQPRNVVSAFAPWGKMCAVVKEVCRAIGADVKCDDGKLFLPNRPIGEELYALVGLLGRKLYMYPDHAEAASNAELNFDARSVTWLCFDELSVNKVVLRLRYGAEIEFFYSGATEWSANFHGVTEDVPESGLMLLFMLTFEADAVTLVDIRNPSAFLKLLAKRVDSNVELSLPFEL